MAGTIVCYEGPIVSRAEALRLGLTYYFTGKPCIHGHIAQRFTSRWICVECNRDHTREVYRENREAINAERRSAEGRSRLTAQKRRWHAANPGKHREYNRQKRARRFGAEGRFTVEDERKLLATQNRCHICGRRFTAKDPATIDHVIALADGGQHDPSNIALAHASCNNRKKSARLYLL